MFSTVLPAWYVSSFRLYLEGKIVQDVIEMASLSVHVPYVHLRGCSHGLR